MPTSHGDQPATRADVLALDEKMEGRLQKLESKMDGRFAEFEGKIDGRFADVDRLIKEVMKAVSQSQLEILERTQEMVRDAQTELLRGFEAFAGGQNIRFRKVQADLSNVDASTDQRLVVLEHRLLEIEHRLQIPPRPPQPPPAP